MAQRSEDRMHGFILQNIPNILQAFAQLGMSPALLTASNAADHGFLTCSSVR